MSILNPRGRFDPRSLEARRCCVSSDARAASVIVGLLILGSGVALALWAFIR